MSGEDAYRPEDDDLPEITDDTIGAVFVDKYDVTWVCEYSDDLGCFVWIQMGHS